MKADRSSQPEHPDRSRTDGSGKKAGKSGRNPSGNRSGRAGPYQNKTESGKAGRHQRGAGKSGGSKPSGSKSAKRPAGALELKPLGGNRFVFMPPECALDRDLDLAEVLEMRSGGEEDIAKDELLYLVADCRGFLEAYLQLAEIALEDEDISLAKGHFGFAYEQGLETLPPHFRGQLPAKEGYNAHFFAAGRGLARCLVARKEPEKAREVLEQLLRFDPAEEGARSLLDQLNERIRAQASGQSPG